MTDEAADICEKVVTPKDANDVLWHYGPQKGAVEPGSFRRALVRAAAFADHNNLAQLGLAFPGVAAGVMLITRREDGAARLIAKLG